jgi:esterase/lipase superfamily enzyme
MERRTTAWFSHHLNSEMPLVAYGHAGPPLLMFPTAAADYLEYERFHLVEAIKPFIDAGNFGRTRSIVSIGTVC